MMSDRDALRDLHALLYPAASRAIQSHGLRWRYEAAETDALDWAAILGALYRAGVAVPGPTNGTVSFWYLTWRFGDPAICDGLDDILGCSWAEAARFEIWRGAVRGPKIQRHFVNGPAAVQQKASRPGAHLRYAFRLLDEPPPWRFRSGRCYGSVRGRIPLRWTSAPWFVPTDLEERPKRAHHLQQMSAGDSKAILDLVDSTRDAALKMSSADEVEGCITALEAFKGAIRTPSAGAQTCINAIKAVRDHLDDILAKLIESLIDKYLATGLADHLDIALQYLTRMSDSVRASKFRERLEVLRVQQHQAGR